jgi:hypothetical protein
MRCSCYVSAELCSRGLRPDLPAGLCLMGSPERPQRSKRGPWPLTLGRQQEGRRMRARRATVRRQITHYNSGATITMVVMQPSTIMTFLFRVRPSMSPGALCVLHWLQQSAGRIAGRPYRTRSTTRRAIREPPLLPSKAAFALYNSRWTVHRAFPSAPASAKPSC